MSTRPNTPEPSDWLRLLTGSRLQTQVSRSATLDGGALGGMAVAAAVALIVIDVSGAYDLSILALALLGLSFALSVRATRLPGAEEIGPTVAAMRRARETEDQREFEDSLLDDLEEDLLINDQALTRKALLFDWALNFLVLAILMELVGRIVQ